MDRWILSIRTLCLEGTIRWWEFIVREADMLPGMKTAESKGKRATQGSLALGTILCMFCLGRQFRAGC